MASTRVQVVGADRLASGLHNLAQGLPADLAPELSAASRVLESAASGRAPVLTGALARSIRGSASGGAIGVASGLRYAGIQEARRHYARDALAAEQSNVLGVLEGGLRRLVARVKGA